MEFYTSLKEEAKRSEFHTPEFVNKQIQVKSLMQVDLIKAIDELIKIIDSNKERIKRFQESLNGNIDENKRQLYKDGIVKYENLSVLAQKVSEIYLMLLDVYTYGTYSILAENEWDWRAFARHLYTMLYEHSKTVNKQLNDIMRIVKTDLEESYNLTRLKNAKKEFSSFIAENLEFAKQIRVNVDAHFDGDFMERLNLIKNLSYCDVVELYHLYNSKMHTFLLELRPVLEKIRLSADISYHKLKATN